MGEIFNSEKDFDKLEDNKNYIFNIIGYNVDYKSYFECCKEYNIDIKLKEEEKKILIENDLIRLDKNGHIITFLDENFIDKSSGEFLDEARITPTKDNYYIGLFDESAHNFTEDPYFKISWRSDFPDPCTARIKFTGKKYVIHTNKTAVLTGKDAKEFNSIIRKKVKGETVFISLSEEYNKDNLIEAEKIVWDNLLIEFMRMYMQDHTKTEKDKVMAFTELKMKYSPIDFSKIELPSGNYTKIRCGKD